MYSYLVFHQFYKSHVVQNMNFFIPLVYLKFAFWGMSFVLDSLYLSPGKNIPKGKPQSVLNVVCNIRGHIWTDLLLCAVV